MKGKLRRSEGSASSPSSFATVALSEGWETNSLRALIALLLLLSLLLCACNTGSPPQDNDGVTGNENSNENSDESNDENNNDDTDEGKEPLPMDKTYRILFIGNSYTYYNDMPTTLFCAFARTAGYTVEVTAITKGAHKLSQFADPLDTYGAQVEAAPSAKARSKEHAVFLPSRPQ